MLFFELSKYYRMSTDHQIGTKLESPILLKDIPETYAFLRALCKINMRLSFKRIGSVESGVYPNPLDKYEFFMDDDHFSYLFTYSYHHESIPLIPACFQDLNPEASNQLFENLEDDARRPTEPDQRVGLGAIVRLVLLKNGIIQDNDVKWSEEKQEGLIQIISHKGFSSNIEDVIMSDWYNNQGLGVNLNIQDFEDLFVENFHHTKIAQFTPDYIQKRNSDLEKAFNQIKETVRRIQAWLDNENLRTQISLDHATTRLGYTYIQQFTTPFIALFLNCDEMGRYHISFALDTDYLNMLPADMASTLLRRIYEFTPGAMEPFVSIVDFNKDCISLFENLIEESKKDHTIQVRSIPRNPEKSIEDMLNGILINDDDE